MKKLGLSGLLLASIVLTGCGGGGGGGTTPYKKTTGFSQVDSEQYKNAAQAIPKEGSVVQSNINNTPNLGVDTTKTTLNFKQVANRQDVSLTLNESVLSESSTYEGIPIAVNVYKKSLNNGDFYVVGGVADYGHNENDYLSYGMWAYVPSSSSGPEIGFYTDGGDPFIAANIAGLTGTATYSGEALGFYDSGSDVDFATGDVALAANFDNNKISGEITNISFAYMEASNGLNVALQESNIDSSKEGGFWTGDTLTTNTDNNAQYVGKWGGQFYGNGGSSTSDQPEFVAGTFGGAADSGGADGVFVGAFIAKKE